MLKILARQNDFSEKLQLLRKVGRRKKPRHPCLSFFPERTWIIGQAE